MAEQDQTTQTRQEPTHKTLPPLSLSLNFSFVCCCHCFIPISYVSTTSITRYSSPHLPGFFHSIAAEDTLAIQPSSQPVYTYRTREGAANTLTTTTTPPLFPCPTLWLVALYFYSPRDSKKKEPTQRREESSWQNVSRLNTAARCPLSSSFFFFFHWAGPSLLFSFTPAFFSFVLSLFSFHNCG